MTFLQRCHYQRLVVSAATVLIAACVAVVAASAAQLPVPGEVVSPPVGWAVLLAAVGVGANAVIRAVKELRGKNGSDVGGVVVGVLQRVEASMTRQETNLAKLGAVLDQLLTATSSLRESVNETKTSLLEHRGAAVKMVESIEKSIAQSQTVLELTLRNIPDETASAVGNRLRGVS